MEEGLDTFVVVDGIPKIEADKKEKLLKYLMRKLKAAGNPREQTVHMPMGDDGLSMGSVPSPSNMIEDFHTNYNSSASRLSNTRLQTRLQPQFAKSTEPCSTDITLCT